MSDNQVDTIEKRCIRVNVAPRHSTFNHPNRVFRKTFSRDEFKTFMGSDASNSTNHISSHHRPLSSAHNKQPTSSTMKNKSSVQKKIVSSNSNQNVQHNTSQVSSVTHQSVKLSNRFNNENGSTSKTNVTQSSSSKPDAPISGNNGACSSINSQKGGLHVQSSLSQNSKSIKSNQMPQNSEFRHRVSGSTHSNQKSSSVHKTPSLKTTYTQPQEPAKRNSYQGEVSEEIDDNVNHVSAKRMCINRLSLSSSKKSKSSDLSSSIASNSNDLLSPQIGSRLCVDQFPDAGIPVEEAMSIESLSRKVAELEWMVRNLSSKMDQYQHELSRGISHLGSHNPRKELSPFLHGCVNTVVKEIFKAVKFLDSAAILQIGDQIVAKFLQKSNQDPENIHDKAQYNAVIHKAKKILSVHKCHVKASIRSATADLLLQDNCGKIGVGELWFVHVNFFRVGHFSNASVVVQSAWIQFCKYVLVHVNKTWKESITQENKLVSSVCTVSDEAFAIQVGKTDMHSWLQKYVDKKQPQFSRVVKNIHPLPLSKTSNYPAGTTSDDDDDDDDNTAPYDGTNGGEGLGGDDEDGDEDHQHNDDQDGDGQDGDDADDDIQEGKDTNAENEEPDDAEDDNQDGDNKGEDISKDRKKNDRINETEYYHLFTSLLSLKQNNLEDWTSWDEGYKNTIEEPGNNSSSSRSGTNSSVPSQINYAGPPVIQFEDF